MDIEERLKLAKAGLQKTVDAINALDSLGQKQNDLTEYTIRFEERIKVYEEILEGKTTIEDNFPGSLYKVREQYRKCKQ